MVDCLKRDQIDEKKWSACLSSSTSPLIYAAPYFLDVVCPGWHALVEDDYQAIMPLPHHVQNGEHILFSPPFAQQLGVFSKQINKDLMFRFLKMIPSHFRIRSINLNSKIGLNDIPLNGALKFRAYRKLNYELPLNRPFELISKAFSLNRVRDYKKAVQAGLSIFSDLTVDAFMEFCMLQDTRPKIRHSLICQLIKASLARKTGYFRAVANEDGKLFAVNFFLNSFGRIINFYPVSSLEGKKKGAMTFLLAEEIRCLAEKKDCLDFEGGNRPGVVRFYGSFGGKPQPFYILTHD